MKNVPKHMQGKTRCRKCLSSSNDPLGLVGIEFAFGTHALAIDNWLCMIGVSFYKLFPTALHCGQPALSLYVYTNFCKVQSVDDNCGEWVECIGVASGCS